METINYIKHLNGVFNSIAKDNRLNPSHISLYMTLFQLWNFSRFAEIFFIDRDETMSISKIGSKNTYHRCLKNLNDYGYIKYLPSHNPFKGSRIKMFSFEETNTRYNDPDLPKIDTTSVHVPTNLPKSGTSSVHVPINLPKSGTSSVHVPINLPKNGTSSVPEVDKNNTKNWTCAGHEEDNLPKIDTSSVQVLGNYLPKSGTSIVQALVPLINNNKHNKQKKTVETGAPKNELEVIDFFKNENWPELEAKKFFNYYQGLNWSVGQTKIYDWHAIAKNWMLRMKEVAQAQKTVAQKTDNLKTCNFKNFNEPL